MLGIIAAVSPEGVIGVDGTIPWRYRADWQRVKRLTEGTTVIMGRNTWDSLPKKPLPNRRNVVITSRSLSGVETYPSLSEALEHCHGDVWFFGGAGIYEEALLYADFIDLTYVPDSVKGEGAVYFPSIDLETWEPQGRQVHEGDARLERQVFVRRKVSR